MPNSIPVGEKIATTKRDYRDRRRLELEEKGIKKGDKNLIITIVTSVISLIISVFK